MLHDVGLLGCTGLLLNQRGIYLLLLLLLLLVLLLLGCLLDELVKLLQVDLGVQHWIVSCVDLGRSFETATSVISIFPSEVFG